MGVPAPRCTSTWCPCDTSSRTLAGVRPTRYSLFLISLGRPMSMFVSWFFQQTYCAQRLHADTSAVKQLRWTVIGLMQGRARVGAYGGDARAAQLWILAFCWPVTMPARTRSFATWAMQLT